MRRRFLERRRQRIGDTTQVHGIDVIVPHRLAKNSVPSHEYILATRDLLERLPEAQRVTADRVRPWTDRSERALAAAAT